MGLWLWEAFVNWLRSFFFKQEMELSLIGLQNAGKTSLVNVIATGGFSEDMIPTVGFNMKKVTKGNVTSEVNQGFAVCGRDTAELFQLLCMPSNTFNNYVCDRASNEKLRLPFSILTNISSYVVNAADFDNLPASRGELHHLLSKPSLNGIPLLVLGNKIDQPGGLSEQDLMEQMGLKSINEREVCCFMISCKNSTNVDTIVDWLVKHSKSKN